MAERIDVPEHGRVELDGGEVVELVGGMVRTTAGVEAGPALVLRMPASRAHSLAHLMDDWSRALGLAPPKGWATEERVLSRTLEAGAATLGEPGAMRCTARQFGEVSAPQRLAAVTVLAERESRLSAVQRFAVVDAAARWLGEDSGDELAYALLAAVCGTDVTTNQVYTALLTRPAEESVRGESR
jgi:hypothetical protein